MCTSPQNGGIMEKDELLKKPFDQYQRYKAVQEIIHILKKKTRRKQFKILDVGGYYKDQKGRDILPLQQFLPEDRIVVLDPSHCRTGPFVKGNALRMPFRPETFDVVCSQDVLEHIPEEKRASFLENLLSVSKNFLILGAPFQGKNNELAEKILFEFIELTLQAKHKELEEHTQHGLPRRKEVESFLKERELPYCDFPSGYLNNWLLFMMVKHYLLSLPRSQRLMANIDRYYNTSFYESDQRAPAYRHMFVAAKNKKYSSVLHEISDKFKGYREKHKNLTLEKADLSKMQMMLNLAHLRDRKKMEELNNEIQEQRVHLKNFKKEVEEKRELIDHLNTEIKNRDTHIQNYKNEIDEYQKRVSEYHSEINRLNKDVYDKDVHIRNVENNLNMILNSKVWRAADFFRRLFYMKLLRIFPPLQKAVMTLTREGFGSLKQKVKRRQALGAKNPYDIWMEQNALDEEKIKKIKEDIPHLPQKPKISIVMPVYNGEKKWLEKAIHSVCGQLYENWELCIVDDASSKKETLNTLKKYQKEKVKDKVEGEKRQVEDKIKVQFLEKNQGISGASNQALAMAAGEYVGFLDHDDELSPDALYEAVKLINSHPEADLIYSDEDKLDSAGNRIEPFFKPDWSPDLLLSFNYICHFTLLRKKLLDELAGFRKGFEGSQDYDLLLRATEKTDSIFHIPKILYHWRQVAGSAASFHKEKFSHVEKSMKALRESLERRGIQGDVKEGIHFDQFESYRVKRKIKDSPLVSIIIPMKDKVSYLKTNLQSIQAKTQYENYEILIVDNNSEEKETLDYFKKIREQDNIRILEFKEPFNFSRINNFAVENARGDHIFFLNNDIEALSEGWLSAMLEHSQRPEVGAVGAKLIFGNDTIQHAGIILGLGGVAGHSHKHFPAESNGYFGALNTIRNYSAVTAACMLTRKEVFEEVGGFDDVHLCVAFNDVDLCLRMREKGYLIVYTPYASLYHYESKSRGYDLNPDEIMYMKNKWGDVLFRDPYYNPNLTFDSEDFRIKI